MNGGDLRVTCNSSSTVAYIHRIGCRLRFGDAGPRLIVIPQLDTLINELGTPNKLISFIVRKAVYSLLLPVGFLIVAGGASVHLISHRGFSQVRGPDRTITLTVEKAQFMRNGVKNPDLSLETGETVRLVFRNTAHGVTHTFSVPSQTDEVYEVAGGEQVSISLRFEQPGEYRYTCPTHEPFMSGKIIVSEGGR